jgi:hypothetical protein
MSEFEIEQLPGGEVRLHRTLTEHEDGVEDHVSFMLRYEEQKELVGWIVKHRSGWLP